MSERWFPDSMPQPMVDHHTLPWWQGAAEHRLLVQQCARCFHCQLPPAPICSACHAVDTRLREVSGTGTLYTYTVVHRAVAIEQSLPFVIAVIELDMTSIANGNRVRMMSNIVDARADELRIGQPVTVVWETLSDEVSVPRFRLAD